MTLPWKFNTYDWVSENVENTSMIIALHSIALHSIALHSIALQSIQ